ncbi:hypothetical protein JCM15765_36190 [Paradesulfitobacterium aromaticivorans]
MQTRIQVTLTVSEGKRLIAKGIVALPEVLRAVDGGKILLKGGTTVSAVSEEMVGQPLKISGRISPSGARTCRDSTLKGHVALLTGGRFEIVDNTLKDVVPTLGCDDVVIIGANILDLDGNAAMCVGGALGGPAGEVLTGIQGSGAKIIIAVGLEKLIPGRVSDAVMAAGRNTMNQAQGMAFGLVPLIGKVITEREALSYLVDVSCTVIAKGGIDGAEGATTMVVVGQSAEVAKAAEIVNQVRGSVVSGMADSLIECQPGGTGCRNHKGCLYKAGRKQFQIQ